jgi:hypothetical protein
MQKCGIALECGIKKIVINRNKLNINSKKSNNFTLSYIASLKLDFQLSSLTNFRRKNCRGQSIFQTQNQREDWKKIQFIIYDFYSICRIKNFPTIS